MPGWYEDISEALAVHGLLARGTFHPESGDNAPDGAGTILLAGNAGPGMWAAFAASGDRVLDDWSRAVLEPLAARFGATALFPFGGPPYLPFQRWAMKAEPVASSPLGILIHPEYGLWHGYRGAFAFPDRREQPPRGEQPTPCESCPGRPCLSTCPVSAFEGKGYDVPACAGWLAGDAGGDCMSRGCLARLACPVGRDFIYAPEQAEFHMRAFLAARG